MPQQQFEKNGLPLPLPVRRPAPSFFPPLARPFSFNTQINQINVPYCLDFMLPQLDACQFAPCFNFSVADGVGAEAAAFADELSMTMDNLVKSVALM
jgi:hypothetical protein